MRILTTAEKEEFEKTFKFIDHRIGSAYDLGAKTIQEIKFDGVVAQKEILEFVNSFNYLNEIPEINWKASHNQTPLHKISNLFNNSTPERKKVVMDKLINYCFRKKVQPSKLRVIGFKKCEVVKVNREEPILYEYGAA